MSSQEDRRGGALHVRRQENKVWCGADSGLRLKPYATAGNGSIGSTSLRGLHHLVYEVVDNSIDEALWLAIAHIGN